MSEVTSANSTIQSFRLLAPTEAPSLSASSPHAIDLEKFVALFGGSPWRLALLEALKNLLSRLNDAGAVVDCLLIGGSFVRPNADPGDLDGLLVYRLRDPTDPAGAFAAMRERVPGLDLRFVPGDAEPALLIKMGCFFHTLYQSFDKGGPEPSFLISLKGI